jgi:CDGSH iron-sulfur domain-containing protein 3
MADAVIAGRAPIAVDVEAGKTYYWCACGKSAKQPFCDGSHKGGEFSPRAHIPAQSGKVYFCACKHSAKAPPAGHGPSCISTRDVRVTG